MKQFDFLHIFALLLALAARCTCSVLAQDPNVVAAVGGGTDEAANSSTTTAVGATDEAINPGIAAEIGRRTDEETINTSKCAWNHCMLKETYRDIVANNILSLQMKVCIFSKATSC